KAHEFDRGCRAAQHPPPDRHRCGKWWRNRGIPVPIRDLFCSRKVKNFWTLFVLRRAETRTAPRGIGHRRRRRRRTTLGHTIERLQQSLGRKAYRALADAAFRNNTLFERKAVPRRLLQRLDLHGRGAHVVAPGIVLGGLPETCSARDEGHDRVEAVLI